MNDLITRASQLFAVSASALRGPRRLRAVVEARQAVMWAAWRDGYTLVTIGRALGKRDHSTIAHGVRRAERLATLDAEYARCLAALL